MKESGGVGSLLTVEEIGEQPLRRYRVLAQKTGVVGRVAGKLASLDVKRTAVSIYFTVMLRSNGHTFLVLHTGPDS